ncbi:peptidase family m28 family [Botrytis cinerea]
MKCYNPSAFVPMAVTLVTVIIYLGVFIPLLIIQETVPSAPDDPTLYNGLNLTEAWLDLQSLSDGYHPFNSRKNDDVRNWLLKRIGEILDHNQIQYSTETESATISETQIKSDFDAEAPESVPSPSNSNDGSAERYHEDLRARKESPAVTVFNDLRSNYSSNALTSIGVKGRKLGISTYFEGNNIICYVRGSDDEEGEWWKTGSVNSKGKVHGKGGVMVNAHFDSVSTGFGATDDGVGKGFVALFNNGEEDGLYGAKAFLSHPMARFVHTFLNLEGAGAGGRATLFRSTDSEVTRAYAHAKHPFGTVVSSDGFSLGYVRSETDYVVFRAEGYRGLDVAFWQPRSQYHTDQDDAKHTSIDSLWHMLSASVATTRSLTKDTGNTFLGPRGDDKVGKVSNGKGSDGVWFDIFGTVFAVFKLRTLFAWSLTLLIAAPLMLFAVSYLLNRQDKFYFFAGSIKAKGPEDEPISLGGWRGAFRYPITLIITCAITFGCASLINKINPMIVYSSPYSVWSMSASLFFSIFWFIMAGCNFVRPSALQRGYAFMWLFVFGWIILVAATVYEDRFKISGGYLFVFYEAAIFLATLIAIGEQFALPKKSTYVENSQLDHDGNQDSHHQAVMGTDGANGADEANASNEAGQEEDPEDNVNDLAVPHETTPLIGGGAPTQRSSISTTFANRYRQVVPESYDGPADHHDKKGHKKHPYGGEQDWSAKLPIWTWLVQYLLVGPFILIVVGQVGLFLVAALHQTGTDGSPLLLPYLVVAVFSILLLLPVTPFIHRLTHHMPTFFFLVFIGTLIYNLVAFPFSPNNRYKAYFQQTVDLDTGLNKVTIVGIEQYIREIIAYIPSAAGQTINCEENPRIRSGLSFCSYEGIAPRVVDNVVDGIPPEKGYTDWLTYNVTRVPNENKATFHISGLETRACILRFDDPFSEFKVHGGAKTEERWDDVPDSGSDQIKLWSRDWNKEWKVDVEWAVGEDMKPGEEGRTGRVVCLWSDANERGVIPALDEARRFSPDWTSVVKLMDGLVEGSKRFVV